MPDKVLVIDDDEAIVDMVAGALESDGYQVRTAGNGIDGLHCLAAWQPDLVILDLMMPGLSGWDTCRQIREISDVPVIMLTGVRGPSNEMRGLCEGADLYITKPFDIPLLVARAQALLRRSRTVLTASRRHVVSVGDLQIDLTEQAVMQAGRHLDLSPTEFKLLATLAATPGRVVTNQELIREVWGDESLGDPDQYLKLYIYYLRHKIEEDPRMPRYIRNRRGIGYMLIAPSLPED